MTRREVSHQIGTCDPGKAADRAARAIPPLWPLASSVAVNPFLGQTAEPLAMTDARLARVAGVSVTMPASWYLDRIARGDITDRDLSDALSAAPAELRSAGLAKLKAAARAPEPTISALPTVADLAANVSRIDWPGLIAERFGAWASGHFDEGQALWAAPRGKTAYAAWRAIATHDLTPEILGLSGFAAFVSEASEDAAVARARATDRLGLQADAMETYFHRLLVTLGGWAQYARFKLWRAELGGETDDTIGDILTIRLLWEEALFERYGEQIARKWEDARAEYAAPIVPSSHAAVKSVLQEAYERATQRGLAEKLAAPALRSVERRPALQVAFCIDVRSEVFRRALEGVDPGIQTLGFAGFFGLAAEHRGFASDVRERRMPVLLNPSLLTCSGGPVDADADRTRRLAARAKRAWGRFKLAAVSSFAFVEATGPIYAAELFRDALRLESRPTPTDPPPRFDPPLDLSTRAGAAETVLKAMSLTANFARLVVFAGHGANVVNNPHARGLHCGACGGYSGEVNARLLAALLNDQDVRIVLSSRDINIPADTLFLAALHDTTTDKVTMYADDHPSESHRKDLEKAKVWLEAAGKVSRGERALGLPRARVQRDIRRRSRDWAEVRPEWGLAGCSAFIAAPRSRTSGRSLEGRAFLHDYDWKQDKGFGVLELIMTAPVVVASWISLQYYGSTVAPEVFGGGNKLLHNVTGGIGVMEGNGGLIRAGLPWQSVHDGSRYVHEPLRLSVCIEAPRAAMTEILRRNDGVRALFDNRWLHLLALDDTGGLAWRYDGDLRWTRLDKSEKSSKPTLGCTFVALAI